MRFERIQGMGRHYSGATVASTIKTKETADFGAHLRDLDVPS
jgi:hypothetical protein